MKNLYKKHLGSKLAAVAAVAATMTTNASAALTASDVDFAPAQADIGVVVLALIGVAVTVFGFRKVLSLLNGR